MAWVTQENVPLACWPIRIVLASCAKQADAKARTSPASAMAKSFMTLNPLPGCAATLACTRTGSSTLKPPGARFGVSLSRHRRRPQVRSRFVLHAGDGVSQRAHHGACSCALQVSKAIFHELDRVGHADRVRV